MSENSANVLYDGFAALDGGMNGQENHAVVSDTNQNGLDRNQVANAINCTFRGGLGATHRPPFVRRALLFPDAATINAFELGLWQGFTVHTANESSLIVAISGHVYQVKVEQDFKVGDLTIAGDVNPANMNYAWFVQAGPFTVIQDGISKPLFFDGTSLRRAADFEMKPGGPMAFSQGRIWYAVYDQYNRLSRFRATDLIGGRSGTSQYNFEDSVLMEIENTFLNEGGDFPSRADFGEIRAMIVPRMLDTSLGQGPLQVFCERGVLSVSASVDRTQWKNVTYPILTESQLDYGAKGSRFAVNVNGDILYRTTEGFHSFQLSRSDFKTWINPPISSEVDSIIEGDPEPYLFWGSAVNFDSRFIATTLPRPTPGGFVHDGLVALDMNLVSSLRRRLPPSWEGLWTGLSVLQIAKGTFGDEERCFAFCRNASGHIELWEILPTTTDIIWDNGENPIVWSFETAALDFGRAVDVKRLITGAVWTAELQEVVEFVLQWRPDQHPCYLPWHAWSDCAPVRQCTLPRCGTPRNLRPQYRPKVRLPQPPDICNGVNQSIYRDGCEHQFRVQVTGHVQIRKMRFACDPIPEPTFDGCPLVGPCLPLDCCSPDPLEYSSAPYHQSGSSGDYSYAGSGSEPYPQVFYPEPPHDYPEQIPPSIDAPIINPPVAVGPPTPTVRTFDFPGLPPVVLYPDPTGTRLVGAFEFDPSWTGTFAGTLQTHDVGLPSDSFDQLQDGTLTDWCTQTWQQFSDYVVANGLTILTCQIQEVFTGEEHPNGGHKKWMADALFRSAFFYPSYGLGYSLIIVYNTI